MEAKPANGCFLRNLTLPSPRRASIRTSYVCTSFRTARRESHEIERLQNAEKNPNREFFRKRSAVSHTAEISEPPVKVGEGNAREATKAVPVPTVPVPGAATRERSRLRYLTPLVVIALAGAVIMAMTGNWVGREGARVEQVTNDAYVRGDLTPLSTKASGVVREVKVNDYQVVHKGDLLVQLDDDDYKAQVAQAAAGVDAAKAALENNRRQRELQDSKIERALAGIDQANAQITAAQAGKDAVQADVTRTRAERNRQEALLKTNSTTQQTVEKAVADEQRFAAQYASRDADLSQARTLLRSNELAA